MKLLLKLALSLGLLSYLFTHMHYHAVWAVLKTINVTWYAVAIIFLFLATLTAAFRWMLVMEQLGFHHRFSFFGKSYFKGSFFNQFLPTSIGGDAYRVIELGQQSHYTKKQAFYGIFVDRIYGYIGLMALNLIGNCYKTIPIPHSLLLMVNVFIACGVLGFVLLVHLHRLKNLPTVPGLHFMLGLSKAASDSFAGWRDLVWKFSLSVFGGFNAVLSVYCIGLSLQLPYPFLDYLLIIPLVNIILLLPISLAGWGLREGAMVGLFALNGAAKPEIMSLSLLFGVSFLILGLPGCYFWLHTPKLQRDKTV